MLSMQVSHVPARGAIDNGDEETWWKIARLKGRARDSDKEARRLVRRYIDKPRRGVQSSVEASSNALQDVLFMCECIRRARIVLHEQWRNGRDSRRTWGTRIMGREHRKSREETTRMYQTILMSSTLYILYSIDCCFNLEQKKNFIILRTNKLITLIAAYKLLLLYTHPTSILSFSFPRGFVGLTRGALTSSLWRRTRCQMLPQMRAT